MKIEFYLIGDAQYDIRPAQHRREWMDKTPEAYAYRCLPLSVANSRGWEIRCSHSFDLEWTGGSEAQDVKIYKSAEDEDIGVSGHFGSGILTFESKVIVRTPAGYDLWIMGPTNRFKDGIQALSAVVETDWIPFPFTMNWMVTRPNTRISFSKGEPYCFFFPVRRGDLENFSPELKHIDSTPELKAQYLCAHHMRGFRDTVLMMKQRGKISKTAQLENLKPLRYQGWYKRGQMPDGSISVQSHQRRVRPKPLRDLRTAPLANTTGPPAEAKGTK